MAVFEEVLKNPAAKIATKIGQGLRRSRVDVQMASRQAGRKGRPKAE
jgi:hypothetical protein